MSKYMSYVDETKKLMEEEVRAIRKKYDLPHHVIKKVVVRHYYKEGRQMDSLKSLDYLYGLLSDYGYTKEEFEKFIVKNSELIVAEPKELRRKTVILNYQNLLEEVLFEHPYKLLSKNTLSSNEIYSIGRMLIANHEEVNFQNVFSNNLSYSDLKKILEQYTLSQSKYTFLEQLFEAKRQKRRQENNPEKDYKKDN